MRGLVALGLLSTAVQDIVDLWADPVETLLDLHELRLEKQAAELA